MAATPLTVPLSRIALFNDLTALQINEIARYAQRVMFKQGQVIVRCDETADAAFLIVSGDAVRMAGPELGGLSAVIEAGSLVGEMAMIVETEHTSTIVARGPVRALKITREGLLAHMQEDPTLADRLVERISARLRQLALDLRAIDVGLAGPPVTTRSERRCTEPCKPRRA
jgi:CRP/FNR family transcriptional regulator, cyclic AMP receptor protein